MSSDNASGLPAGPQDHSPASTTRPLTEPHGDGEGHWAQHLDGAPARSALPSLSEGAGDPRGGTGEIPFSLPVQLHDAMRELAADEGCRPLDVLVALVQTLVHRCAAQDDVVIAVPPADGPASGGRDAADAVAGVLPRRAVFTAATTFREQLRATRTASEDARRHQDVPLGRILELAGLPRDAGLPSLCQVMVGALGRPMPAPGTDGPETGPDGPETGPDTRMASGVAYYDLELHLGAARDGGLSGWFRYRADRYTRATVASTGVRLGRLAGSALARPDVPVVELELLPADERAQLLRFTETAVDYGVPRRLHDHILDQALRSPEAIAVRDEAEEIDYAELVARARALARRLRAHGVGPDVIVAVCAQRSVALAVALLGILMADGAYLPLDRDHPVARIRTILDEARPAVVLADAGSAPLFTRTPPGPAVLPLDGGPVPEAAVPAPGREPSDADLAYVIYTSGSTGQPKGVAIPHRGIVNRLLWMQRQYLLTADDVVLQKTPYTFDVSVWEFFWPLMAGARLVMARPDGHRDPEYLAEVMADQGVTTAHFVPSMLAVFTEEPGLSRCTALRQVVCSGEALTSAVVTRFRARSRARVHNLYGPTEASVDVTHWTCRDDTPEGGIPIGSPIANTTAYVLDTAGNLAPIGTPGELFLGGVGLARGYVGRPDLTAERFVADPYGTVPGARLYRTGDLARWTADGWLEFLGRLDHQVKLRGLRIELGEIEAVLRGHPSVSEAVVLLRDDLGAIPALVAYLVTAGQEVPGDLTAYLTAVLPAYMVPSKVVALPTMPLTRNGKLDRAALPKPAPAARRRR